MMGKIVAAIPSCRPGLCEKAVRLWKETGQFDEIWVMWDGKEHALTFGADKTFISDNAPDCIPKQTGSCRSWLVYQAWLDPDIEWIVHLDDDVSPYQPGIGYTFKHYIIKEYWNNRRWYNTIDSRGNLLYARGHPYEIRKYSLQSPKIVHGRWYGDFDLDATTEIVLKDKTWYKCGYWDGNPHVISNGYYFPMSSMAVAIHRDLFPASYFMWMGKNYDFFGYGDIWCGIILKKICDHLGWLVVTGAPAVKHDRASDVWENLKHQVPSMSYNEDFWKWVDNVDLSDCETVLECYERIVEEMYMPEEEKFDVLKGKMEKWLQLFRP